MEYFLESDSQNPNNYENFSVNNSIEKNNIYQKKYKESYWKTTIHMILMGIVITGAINGLLSVFNFNLINITSDFINKATLSNLHIDKILYILIGIAAILIAIKQSTWLPFLGSSILPESLIPLNKPSKHNKIIKIKTIPNSKVAYWCSLPNKDIPDVITAYGDYSNSGVVMSDNNGIAELPILEGTSYRVNSGKIIPRHLHYRIVGLPYGMMGRIKTVNY